MYYANLEDGTWLGLSTKVLVEAAALTTAYCKGRNSVTKGHQIQVGQLYDVHHLPNNLPVDFDKQIIWLP